MDKGRATQLFCRFLEDKMNLYRHIEFGVRA
jgi:hypothetical protein